MVRAWIVLVGRTLRTGPGELFIESTVLMRELSACRLHLQARATVPWHVDAFLTWSAKHSLRLFALDLQHHEGGCKIKRSLSHELGWCRRNLRCGHQGQGRRMEGTLAARKSSLE